MNTTKYKQSDSKVEVKGFEARHYDLMMNMISIGSYPFFIRHVVKDMHIQPQDKILDLGCGSGRNIRLMTKYLSDQGKVLGLDIGSEMLEQAQAKCEQYTNVEFKNLRIDEVLPYENEFDKVFISFVLHGFVQEKRLQIIKNARRALHPGGEFIILDYNEFDLKSASLLARFAFKVECPLATDFISRDLKGILRENGFDKFRTTTFYKGYVRLLTARKANTQ